MHISIRCCFGFSIVAQLGLNTIQDAASWTVFWSALSPWKMKVRMIEKKIAKDYSDIHCVSQPWLTARKTGLDLAATRTSVTIDGVAIVAFFAADN